MNKLAATILLICLPMLAGCSGKSLSPAEKAATAPGESIAAVVEPGEPYQYAVPFDAEFYARLYDGATTVPDIGKIEGAIVPHHLVGGYLPATLFKYLAKQKPPLVVIFGPNHYNRGDAPIISTARDWQTPFGPIKTADKLVGALAEQNIIKIDEEVIKEEHSVNSLVSFVKQSLPDAQLAVFVSHFFTSTDTINKFIETAAPLIPDSAVIISSIDFSHYQNTAVADFHDELTKRAIRNFDYERLSKLEIDSPPSLYFLLKIMEKRGAKKIAYELSGNSSDIMKDPALEKTTSYYTPYFVTGDNEPQKIAAILNFGDTMLDRNVKKQIDANGADYIFTKLAGDENRFFMGMDLIGANLEGPFANSRRATSKEIAFRFDPVLLPTLKKYNFGIFSQANNHSLDMGSAGFAESEENLAKFGFDFYGSQYRVDTGSLLIKKVGDFNIGFIGLNDTNSPIDLDAAKKLLAQSKNNADFTIVNMHWGAEYKEISNSRQRYLAHALIDAGADVIIGHHPHVVEEMEIYKNRPIFYSLGNFVFDQYFSVPTQQSLAVGLVLKEKSISAYIFPLEQEASQPRQMPYDERIKYFNQWLANCRLNNYQFENQKLIIEI